jgi:hypothetical protein
MVSVALAFGMPMDSMYSALISSKLWLMAASLCLAENGDA